MSAPTQPRLTSPEVRSTPLYPRSLQGARLAEAAAQDLAETAATHAGRYDAARQHLGQNAVDLAQLLAGSGNDRLAAMRSLREEQSAATVASAEQQLNLGRANEHRRAFLFAAGLIVNLPPDRSSMIAMEPRE